MKSAGLFLLVIGTVRLMSAEPWDLIVDASLWLTQNAYSNNWVGGEAGSFALIASSNSYAEKQLNPAILSRNTLQLALGVNYNQDPVTKAWSKPIKSTDLIDLESIMLFTLQQFFDPFASLRIESQFIDASERDHWHLFNPMTFTESSGLAEFLIKGQANEWLVRFGPALRQQLDRYYLDTLGMGMTDYQIRATNAGGLLLRSDFYSSFAEGQLTLISTFTLFEALFYFAAHEFEGTSNEDAWRSPVVEWENILLANITDYLVVDLYLQVLYDNAVDANLRFKETLSLGLSFTIVQ